MADSENRNNVHKERIAMREAILTCLIPDDIADLVRNLIDIASDKEQKTADRISATRTIFLVVLLFLALVVFFFLLHIFFYSSLLFLFRILS